LDVFAYPPNDAGHHTAQGKEQNMAEPQETRQEQETRWAAQRATRDKAFQVGRHARHRKNRRTWLIVAVIVLILAVIVAVVLL
jgi:t-SNARE complex subunit (syntaxin)